MRRACIIAGGAMDCASRFKGITSGCDMVLCADSGLDHALSMGIVPDVVLGDMDSAQCAVPPGVKLVKVQSEKDMTDTRLAIDYALEAGCRDIVLLCALGGRFDHALANVAQLVYIAARGGSGMIAADKNEIELLRGPAEMTVEAGDFTKLSLLPFGGDACGITTQGLKYPLCGGVLESGSDRGVSNEFCGRVADIKLAHGMLLVIKSRD